MSAFWRVIMTAKGWSSPFSFSEGGGEGGRGDETGHWIVCKKHQSSCTHSSAHTRFLFTDWIQFFQSIFPEDESKKERRNLGILWRPLSPRPACLYSVISYFSQNDLATPWELPVTGKIKIAPLTPYIALDCSVLSVAKSRPSSPCLIVKHWYKILPLLFGSEGLKINKTWCYIY